MVDYKKVIKELLYESEKRALKIARKDYVEEYKILIKHREEHYRRALYTVLTKLELLEEEERND